jgi:hypothetical protein
MFTLAANDMKGPLLLIVVGMLASACNVEGGSVDLESHNARYSRAECITRFSVEWRNWGRSPDILEGINRKLSEVIAGTVPRSEFPIAGIRYAELGRDYFIQFSDRCEERVQLTELLIARYFGEAHPIDSYWISEDRVDPSPHTIDITGPAWVD